MSEPVKIISQAQFLPVQEKADVKLLKEDDASAPVHLWDNRLLSTYLVPSVFEEKFCQCLCTALNKSRNFILRFWFQFVYSSFVRYFQT